MSTLNWDEALLSQLVILVIQDGGEEGLDQLGGLLIVALGADDVVGGQDERVCTLVVGGEQCLGVNNHVVLGVGLLELQVLQSLVDGLGGQLNRAVAEVDLGLLDALAFLLVCEASLDVGDSTIDACNLVSNAGGAVSTLTNRVWELLALGVPVTGSGLQELLEVCGGTGLVRTEDDGDVLVRQVSALVISSDGLVVPLLDFALEDLAQGLGGEVNLGVTQVVGDCNRTDGGWQVPCLVAIATLSSSLDLTLVFLQSGVRTSEVSLAIGEGLNAGAGTGSVVGQEASG